MDTTREKRTQIIKKVPFYHYFLTNAQSKPILIRLGMMEVIHKKSHFHMLYKGGI